MWFEFVRRRPGGGDSVAADIAVADVRQHDGLDLFRRRVRVGAVVSRGVYPVARLRRRAKSMPF